MSTRKASQWSHGHTAATPLVEGPALEKLCWAAGEGDADGTMAGSCVTLWDGCSKRLPLA